MALSSLRLRRALTLSSSLINHQRPLSAFPANSTSPSLSSATADPQKPSSNLLHHLHHRLPFQSRHFSSYPTGKARNRNFNNNYDEIGEDTILFEGCDYNHWLITMDFPKDPAPTREEMIETYLQTLAKVVGSYEEAKKKMYAFSTTTYQGFQCLVSEETSEKFKELPGVVFVLPDSYIDPVNKEYGGDKYDNGVITPRPPPVQYGRSAGRYGDRNRDQNRPRPPMPNQQANPAYVNRGPIYGDARNSGQQANSSMQPTYGPGGGGDRRDPMPPYQATYNQNERGYYNPQGGRTPPEQRNYMPPGKNDLSGDSRNYAPPPGVTYGQGAPGNYGQGAPGNYSQGAPGNYGHGAPGNYGQRAGGNYSQGAPGNYSQGPGGNYSQGAPGNYSQGPEGNYGQGGGAVHKQETGLGYGQSYHPGHGEERRFTQVEQRDNMQGQQRNYPPTANTDQVRY